MPDVTQFDHYLTHDGPAALVIREHLMPVEGTDGVLFPATYAKGENFDGGYNIDVAPDGKNVALIDSVGSQANRIEPMFLEAEYRELVPQVAVKAGAKVVSIFEAGHRAGDALLRCSPLKDDLQAAFKDLLRGDATPLAKIAPTSLVFGVWDSRDTQAKLPRVVASTIRAYNVRELRRSAQFNPAAEYINEKLLDDPADKATRDAYSVKGFTHVPASATHGGVIADGGVRRDATLALAALRLLHAERDEAKTLALRRYILGLSLVAFTANRLGYLRQGCLLVPNPDAPREFSEVGMDGRRAACGITHAAAVEYATAAAKEFGVGADRMVEFDKAKAVLDISGEGDTKATAKSRGKGKAKEATAAVAAPPNSSDLTAGLTEGA